MGEGGVLPPSTARCPKRAKRQAKSGTKKSEDKTIPLDQVITLDHLTNPNKK